MSELFTSTTKENIMEGSYDRPAGVSIVSVILAIGGGLLLITQLMNLGRLNEASAEIGLPSLLLQAGIGFLGLLGVTAGVGMWLGKKWGWWVALFYFAYAVTRNVNVLITIPSLVEQFGSLQQDQWAYYVKYGVRIIWNGSLIYYLCSENPSLYFRMTESKKWKAVLIVFAICLLVYLIGTLVAG